MVGLPGARCLPNGVDLDRFRPIPGKEEPGRVSLHRQLHASSQRFWLWSFSCKKYGPQLDDLQPVLQVIAGARHEYYLQFHGKQLRGARMEVEGFVSDVREAYARASVVIAPLTASAGTNIKILEAMAMGKAVVSTPAGINGLDVSHGVLVEAEAEGFARALRICLEDAEVREGLGGRARSIVEAGFWMAGDWPPSARSLRRTSALEVLPGVPRSSHDGIAPVCWGVGPGSSGATGALLSCLAAAENLPGFGMAGAGGS